jgi:hypothetical protein
LIGGGCLPWRTRQPIYLSANLSSADPERATFAGLSQWRHDGRPDRDESFPAR